MVKWHVYLIYIQEDLPIQMIDTLNWRSNSAATIPCQITSWVDFLASSKLSFLFCVARQMFRVSKCFIFMPIQRLSVDSQIRSYCFLVSLVLACGFLINFQRCHVFFVVSNSTTFFLFFGFPGQKPTATSNHPQHSPQTSPRNETSTHLRCSGRLHLI